jgi:hypothetical protein
VEILLSLALMVDVVGGAGSGNGATTIQGAIAASSNIVNGSLPNIGPTGPTPSGNYAVLGNNGGQQVITHANNNRFSAAGGGGIGGTGSLSFISFASGGGGGSGLNQVTINGKLYNFKEYFANNGTFGHNDNGYIGGGGSGSSTFISSSTAGSLGGGGAGNKPGGTTATSGAINTGSGGGGASASGGTGIVIIRYRYPTIPISS